MLIQIHPLNPEIRIIKKIASEIHEGAVYIFPTDSVYALIADSSSKKGIEKIYKLKELDKHTPFSILLDTISRASEYIDNLPNEAFKLMKRITPGPYTFIFKANKNLSRYSIVNDKSKTIGIRIPDNIYLQTLIQNYDGILTSTSVYTNEDYITSPEELEELFGNKVNGIIDGGILKKELSTILDYTSGERVVLREGKGFDLI
jgi:tRNA threonylcarbamoyl adenosine modification protein (Sua5/YciO/YrdC/YwlC family)